MNKEINFTPAPYHILVKYDKEITKKIFPDEAESSTRVGFIIKIGKNCFVYENKKIWEEFWYFFFPQKKLRCAWVFPRLTEKERDNLLPSLANGCIIYNINADQLNTYQNKKWIIFNTRKREPKIGDLIAYRNYINYKNIPNGLEFVSDLDVDWISPIENIKLFDRMEVNDINQEEIKDGEIHDRNG